MLLLTGLDFSVGHRNYQKVLRHVGREALLSSSG